MEPTASQFPNISETLLQHFCTNLKGEDYITHKILETDTQIQPVLVWFSHVLTTLILSCGYIRTPLAARSTARVCGRSLAGIEGSNLTGDMDVCSCVC